MSNPELADDPVARSLASKAFAAPFVCAEMGPFDDEECTGRA